MESINEVMSFLKQSVETYTGGNRIWLLYPVALVLIWILGKKEDRKLFVGAFAVECLTIFNPLLVKILVEKIGFGKNLVMVSVFIFSCITAMIVGNERFRNIIGSIGRTSHDITVYRGTDWVGYRLAALKSFWTGDISIIETFCGKSGTESYVYYTLDSDFGSILFQSNKVILILFICMVLAVSVLLFHIDLEKPKWNRVKNYLAVSYVIRTGIYDDIVYVLFSICQDAVYYGKFNGNCNIVSLDEM